MCGLFTIKIAVARHLSFHHKSYQSQTENCSNCIPLAYELYVRRNQTKNILWAVAAMPNIFMLASKNYVFCKVKENCSHCVCLYRNVYVYEGGHCYLTCKWESGVGPSVKQLVIIKILMGSFSPVGLLYSGSQCLQLLKYLDS